MRGPMLIPSVSMWNYFKGDITDLQIASALADLMAGYGISYSANELLKDLGLLTERGQPNATGKIVVAWYLHEKYHQSVGPIEIVNPLAVIEEACVDQAPTEEER